MPSSKNGKDGYKGKEEKGLFNKDKASGFIKCFIY